MKPCSSRSPSRKGSSQAGGLKIEPSGKFNGHMHSTLHGVWGVAHLGVVLKQPRYLEWSKRVYDYATTQGLGTGWLAAATWNAEVRLLSEMCATSDLISIAAWLAQGGIRNTGIMSSATCAT